MHAKTLALSAIAAVLLGGCSTMAPKPQLPKTDLPEAFDKNKDADAAIETTWWKNFHDQALERLIDEVLQNNDDLQLAAANIAKVRAAYGFSDADLYPHLDMEGSATRQKTSTTLHSDGPGGTYSMFSLSLLAAYEVDLWGRLKNQKEADWHVLLASEADRDAVRLSLIADAANHYFNLVATRNQLAIAKESAKTYDEMYAYRRTQHRHGVVDSLVVAQARAQAANAQVLVQTLRTQLLAQESSLALLLGQSPRAIFENHLEVTQALPKPIDIPAGLPASLLQNRPDIKAAEERLKSKTALIGVAKAAYCPSIALTGNYGYQSRSFGDLMGNGTNAWGIGPSLNLPLLDFGRIDANVKISEADQKSAIIAYGKTVKTAYKEVYEALGTIRIAKTKCTAIQNKVNAYKEALNLATKKFERGTASYLEVLDAQQGLLNARLGLASVDAELLTDQITLYKALGGGWRSK